MQKGNILEIGNIISDFGNIFLFFIFSKKNFFKKISGFYEFIRFCPIPRGIWVFEWWKSDFVWYLPRSSMGILFRVWESFFDFILVCRETVNHIKSGFHISNIIKLIELWKSHFIYGIHSPCGKNTTRYFLKTRRSGGVYRYISEMYPWTKKYGGTSQSDLLEVYL